MGILDWFRKSRGDEPEIIPFPSIRPPEPLYWCNAIRSDESGFVAVSAGSPDLRIEFSELNRVAIRTTDEGPWAEDVYWRLVAGPQECLVPHGAPGETELFERLLKLPGFNSQAMIAAMTCAENSEFDCWARDA